MNPEWVLVAGLAIVAVAIRLTPDLLLAGKEPPQWLARALPWLPVTIAGTFVGALHLDPAGTLRLEYLAAGTAAAASLAWRRNLYVPVVVGAGSLALIRLVMA